MIAVLLSGTGRSLLNLTDCGFKDKIAWVGDLIKNKPICKGLEIAHDMKILTCGFDNSNQIFKYVKDYSIELLVLAGYTKKLVIPDEYIGKVINIHPSLLPSFGGKGMYGMNVHKAVIESGVKFSGCTVHYVTNEYDEGPIILQRLVAVDDDDTPETLANKVFEEEKIALPFAINQHLLGKLKIDKNRVLWGE